MGKRWVRGQHEDAYPDIIGGSKPDPVDERVH
jgi:hypothetical protein